MFTSLSLTRTSTSLCRRGLGGVGGLVRQSVRVERVEVGIGGVDAEFGGSVRGQGAQVGEALFARQGGSSPSPLSSPA
ncbi:hypothetical protein M378DRAFT_734833 [Amanita muscaria Koide BX008]|uniref:Uncharacterized protein n=1 Tax=Amanita muscaria (strain Koide BX008) TaxID=946122 RepID=A0A0C2X1E0_AMAMK|nr:hypothetical protein M378DRAFT_734833 [Amanita muscaria Koide BX008]